MKIVTGILIVLVLLLASCAGINQETAKRRSQSESVVIVLVNTHYTDSDGVDQPMRWSGTGFSIAADVDGSTVLTNKHVCAAGADASYELTDYTGHKHRATFQRVDQGADLCLLHANDIIVPVRLAQHNAVKGEHVSVIGAPRGRFPWFTSGIVSGKVWMDMNDDEYGMHFEIHFWAQGTSVPIYPGNSGSPVFNDSNEVVGIMFAGRGDSEHMTFMVPVSEINRMLDTSENIYER